MRLFRSYSVVLLIALFAWFGMPSGQVQAFSLAEFSKSISGGLASGIDGLTESTAKINKAFSNIHANIRNSVAVSQEKIGATIDTQLVASASVFDSLRSTLYCSITSVLRLDRCNEAEVTQNPSGDAEPSGGTATFIVGEAPAVMVQRTPATPTLIVQNSLPRYIAPVELNGLTEAQVETLIERRISAIVPMQVNNYYESVVGGGGSVGFIQGPAEITTIVERLDDLESGSGNISSQWITSGSNIYYSTGNVGISTTTPGFDLTVDGDVNITGTLNFNGSAGTAGYVLQSQGSSAAPQWVATSSLGFPGSQWTTSGSNIYYTTGNVAIGTTSATGAKLVLNGGILLTDSSNNSITGGTDTSGNGINALLTGGTASSGELGGLVSAGGGVAGTGGAVSLTGRNGSTAGGGITLIAGNSTSHNGSTASFGAGNASSGGQVTISGGTSTGTTGGSVTLNGGSGTVIGPVVLQSGTTGNVGIGTSTPLSARFTIVGAPGSTVPFLVASSSSGATPLFAVNHVGAISVNNSYGAVGSVLVSNGSGSAPAWTATSSLGISQWTTSGSNIYYNIGNVAIGLTNPVSGVRLQVVGGISNDWGYPYFLNGNDNNWAVAGTSTDVMVDTSIISGNRISFVYGSGSNEGIAFGPNGSTTALELLSTSQAFFRGKVSIGTSTTNIGDTLTILGDVRITDYNPSRDEVYIRAGTTTSGNGLNLRLRGGEVIDNSASEISLQGAYSNSGGHININGGTGSVENGGSINISAGGGNSGNSGANVSFNGGNSGGGGEINMNSGSSNSGRGAAIKLNGGNGACCSTATRGYVLLQEFSHGQVGIGTSTPGATFSIKTSDLLTPILVSSSSESTIMFTMLRSGNVGIGTGAPSQLLHVVRSTDGIVARFQDSDGTCDVVPTATALSCSSDARLKKDIESMDSVTMLQKLSMIRPVTFKWKNQTEETLRFGVIAQEIEQYFPEFVTTDITTGYKSVAYTNLIPVLVSSVQELNTRLTRVEEALALAQLHSPSGPLRNMILDTITATLGVFNKVQIEDGVELKDKATGQTYCLTIVMGEWAKTEGECGTNVNTNTGNTTGSGNQDEDDDTGTTTDEVVSDDEETGTSTDPVMSDNESEANEPITEGDNEAEVPVDESEPTIEVSEPTELSDAAVEAEITPSAEE